MPILISTEPTSVTYNTLDAQIPAKSSTLNSEEQKVELCVLEPINGDPFTATSGSAPELDLLIPMAFVIVYVFGWCLFLIAGVYAAARSTPVMGCAVADSARRSSWPCCAASAGLDWVGAEHTSCSGPSLPHCICGSVQRDRLGI